MRQVLVIGVVALLATLATGVASGVVTPGTSLECQFSSKYPGITDTPGVSSGTKTICSSSTFTFLRTDQTCIGGVLYSYPVYLRQDRTYFYAGNAVAGAPDYSGGTQTPVYHQVKPNAQLLSTANGFSGEFHDTDARTALGAC